MIWRTVNATTAIERDMCIVSWTRVLPKPSQYKAPAYLGKKRGVRPVRFFITFELTRYSARFITMFFEQNISK
jgi:hypothetical protein